MRIYSLFDTKIPRSEMETVKENFNDIMRENADIMPVWWEMPEDYSDYPTFIDGDGDMRPTATYLQDLADKVYKIKRDTVDHIIVWVHEDNWKSDPAGPGGIWGTNYSFVYRNYQVHYCRWDRDNIVNSLGTLWHEVTHSFDAFIKTYINFDIVTLFPGMKNWDRDMTHGGCCGHSYIGRKTGRENTDALKTIAPYLRDAYIERHKIADKEMAVFVSLLKQIVVLYRSLLNMKNGVSKQAAQNNPMTISKNGTGIAVLFVSLASLFGLEIEIDSAAEVIAAIGTIVSFCLMIWNQIGRPEVKAFFFKK